VTGALPNVIAASAGGKFGPDGNAAGTPAQGFWHGYSLLRVEPDGRVVVEQRPVFDWVAIRAQEHTLQPGQHVTLRGFGREPVGMDVPIAYDDINSPAITHRYDLVQAEPDKPYLPKVDPTSDAPNHYVLLDPSVATVDRQSGVVRTGGGNHARVYAIGILSVGDKAASWPLVFEPRKNYRPPAPVVLPPTPLPPLHVAAAAPLAPPATQPPPPPQVGTPGVPQLPALPNLPPLSSAPPPPPPAPPAPPPPPAFGQPLPLSLTPKIGPVSFSGTVVPPSPPPVNPAPPSGSAARKEAKQRQAAAAKSEEGSEKASEHTAGLGGDQADSAPNLPGSAMTRADHQSLPFRALEARGQPSAWSRDLYYGGGLAVIAAVLALGFTILRPTPRRRRLVVPAPAWARRQERGRGG
jgi:hypothetical protein